MVGAAGKMDVRGVVCSVSENFLLLPRPPVNVKNLLTCATALLKKGGSPTPRLDSEVLLAHVLRRDRPWLYMYWNSMIQAPEWETFAKLLRMRLAHCPVAYCIGMKEFWTLSLKVSPATLIPRPETEHLVEETLRLARSRLRSAHVIRLWDVGTGCGNIALAVAISLPPARVLATDISPAALRVARENIARSGLSDRVKLLAADLDAPLGRARFDLILSNPPYVADGEWSGLHPSIRNYEPPEALRGGPDGLNLVRRLVAVAETRLTEGGYLVCEIGGVQADAVRSLVAADGGFTLVRISRDYAGKERVLVARKGRVVGAAYPD